MKLVILAIVLTFVAFATCTDYQFGEINEEDDYLIANDKVSKKVWLFGTPSKKYTFKQPKDDRLTITGITVTNSKRGQCTADVKLTKGGPGKTTATLEFKGQKGYKKFSCTVKIYGVV